MRHYLTIGEASMRLGVCPTTLRRWDRDGKIHCYRTPGGHRRFGLIEIERIISGDGMETGDGKMEIRSLGDSKTAIYARVSSHDQKKKGDLARQIEMAKEYCEKQGFTRPQVFKDVSSGLNTKRVGLMRLCQAIEQKKINRVICTYPDRLTRFGLAYLTNYFGSHGTTVEVIEQSPRQSMEEELVQDMVAIITSFSGRVHGLRSAKNRQQNKKKSNNKHETEKYA